MDGDVVLDIFISGLVLIPVIIMAIPKQVDRLLSLSGGKLQLTFFPITIYIIFLSGLGSNLLGQTVVGIALMYFFYLFAAALVALKSRQAE
ncbi:hypothetical protein [Colwellia sp. C1TZA3]|uniref:hypothetical protein n=1 Tax=Colwellia sp. C1TZA3 TaxID=2508879 RepID=UPI0011B995C8|nr:hypothetical protein [Colwellia sp. C1TZA3]TWX63345.1 hypothetical protein ESZ39_17010 [Colwellia sp. C1TZA3]